ncbi:MULTISPECIES: RodZ family helix-turn-helix domain-containing protein [unclassified Nocardia]|uniref:helix-turn-helix domain-containing protein n=1 Tax=unclassified Nocardia TaxID=2637762 RepID=UPI001CE49CAC|nr:MULTISPECIES: helix-turn-helix transcriptional regulator [unclassified Nocardia]
MSRRRSAPVPLEVSEALREARERRVLSREKAAQLANISTSLWTQIENGVQYKKDRKVQTTTTADTLQSMAEAVGLDPQVVLVKAGLESPKETAQTPPSRGGIIDLSGLSEYDLHLVAGYVAGLKARYTR